MSAIKNISLYIPHVFPNFDKEYVANAFNDIGEISQIDFVAKRDRTGKNFNAVYVHFNKWYNNTDNRNFQYNIVENGSDKWYHDDSQYYWIVLPNTAKKHIPGDRKPRIDLGDSNVITTSKNLQPLLAFVPSKVSQKKPTYAEVAVKPLEEVKQSLEVSFDEVAAFEAEIEAELDEIEDFLDEEDENLIKIDGRYVQQLEAENWSMSAEIAQLRAAIINLDQMYQAEKAKVRAFSNVETSVDI